MQHRVLIRRQQALLRLLNGSLLEPRLETGGMRPTGACRSD